MCVLPRVNPKLTLESVHAFSRTYIIDSLEGGLTSASECLTIPVPILLHPFSLQYLQHISTAICYYFAQPYHK